MPPLMRSDFTPAQVAGFAVSSNIFREFASIVASQIGELGYPVSGEFGVVRKALTLSSRTCGNVLFDPLRELQIEWMYRVPLLGHSWEIVLARCAKRPEKLPLEKLRSKLCCGQLACPITNVLEFEDHVVTLSKGLAHMYIVDKVRLVGEH